tara:strand:+ start:4953 stop:7304 length:2352 start_codon:yes stop_codon:yes gene_type:complete
MKKYKLAFLFTTLSIIINSLLFWFGFFDSLEQNLYDFKFKLRGPLSGDHLYDNSGRAKDRYALNENSALKKDYSLNNDIIIIGLDQSSYSNIGRFYPYDRGLIWSKVVDNLVSAGISVITFDIMFDNTTLSDSLFSNSISNATKKGVDVILAANNQIEIGTAGKSFNLVKPSYEILKNSNAKLGLVGTVSDKDGFIRKYITNDPRVNDSYQNKYYSLALQSVLSFKNIDINNKKNLINQYLNIPLYSNQNTFLINYYGPSSYGRYKTFNTIPLHEILDDGSCYPEEGDCEPILKNYAEIDGFMELFTMDEWQGVNPFKNKIAIIGSALQEHHDIFNIPLDQNGEMYGVEIHGHVIQQILDSNYIDIPISYIGLDANVKDKIISFFVILLISFIIFFSMIYFNPINSLIISFIIIFSWINISIGSFINDYIWIIKYIFGIQLNIPDVGESIVLPVIYPITSVIFSYGFNLSYKLYIENQDKKFLKSTFGNYISSDLVDQMYKNKTIPQLGGEEGYHTVIFSDVANFSSISEELSAKEIVEVLNEYLTEMTQIILENGGTIDKYIGDAIVAFYGAPIEVKSHEDKAILSVIEMNEKFKELKKKWSIEDKWPDSIKNMKHRVGVNTGNLVTGNMGSSLQMNYTCMGDAVNLAARLESGSKLWGIDVQVSETVYNATKDNYIYRHLGAIRVKGKNQPVNVYELMCHKNFLDKPLTKLLTKFKSGHEQYLRQNWDEAIKIFNECSELEDMTTKNRETNPSLTYIKICEEFKAQPPEKNWNGVYTFKSK